MVMVLVQIIFAGVILLYKLAYKDGMNLRILVAYRYTFATLFLAPIAFFVERKSRLPLTWNIIFQAFLCIGGAMVLTLYKGAELNMLSTNTDLTSGLGKGTFTTSASHVESGNRVLGSLLALYRLLFLISYALWLIIQTKMSERYPCRYLSSTSLMCMMGAVQSTVFAPCMDRHWNEWQLESGMLDSGLGIRANVYNYSLGVRVRGPLFVSIFNPLMLVLVAIMGFLFLGEKLHVGSLIGAALIVVGLYAVLWGKGKETKMAKLMPSKSSREVDNNHHDPPNLEAATLRTAITEVLEEEEEKEEEVVVSSLTVEF
ncbi:hypothetical protein NE237_028883 [Protea cynaroides]|uniref:WAT1-related protein n=1 Tax=Protea cynaroides TaxID=273540 RepID=A0A9Q0JU94_9MAGN|nr:hypothetical protein NE237_028883 [Protea cynaroides]